jgi:hypothetical protein
MATLTFILTSVQTALTANLFQTSTCFFGFEPEQSMSYPPADSFVVIQPNTLDDKSQFWQGQPNKRGYLWRYSFTLWYFTRLGTDESHRDDYWLKDQTLGSLVAVDSIIDTLQNYVISSNGENFGVKLTSIQWPTRDRPASGWGITKLRYVTDLSSRTQ